MPSKQIAPCLTLRRVAVPCLCVQPQAIANHNESHSARSGGDDKTVGFCKAHGISYSAYSPLEGLSVSIFSAAIDHLDLVRKSWLRCR